MSHYHWLRRRASLVSVLALVLAACGGGQTDAVVPVATTAASAVAATDSTGPATTSSGGGSGTIEATTPASPGERPAPNPDREIAPDFTLNLGSGSTFVLSEETRPVFMVFWAEW